MKGEAGRSRGLSHYLQEIGRTEPLDREQESAVLARMSFAPTDGSRQELVTSHLRFVVHIAKAYKNRGLPLDELIAEGNLGLLRAARHFKPGRNVRFITCAVWWIRKAIRQALDRDAGFVRIPDHRLRAIRNAGAATRQISELPRREDSRLEFPRGLKLTRPELEQLPELRKPPVSLDGREGSREVRLLDRLPDDAAQNPQRILERKEARARLRWGLTHLAPREKEILECRFGLQGEDPLSLKQVGSRLALSRERVRQVETQAKQTLHRFLSRKHSAAQSRSRIRITNPLQDKR